MRKLEGTLNRIGNLHGLTRQDKIKAVEWSAIGLIAYVVPTASITAAWLKKADTYHEEGKGMGKRQGPSCLAPSWSPIRMMGD